MPRFLLTLCLGAALLLAGCAPPAPLPQTPAAGAAAEVRPDPALQDTLEALVRGFRGEVGIYARHLRTGATAEIRADELFPTASMIKVPLLVVLFDRAHRGELALDTVLLYRDSLGYTDADVLGELRDSATISLAEVAFLTAALSDNTAALWIQSLVGGGAAVNQWLSAQGFQHTRVNSRTPGRRPDWERYGWGQTTPREIAELMVRIRRGEVVSAAASEKLYRLLTNASWEEVALAAIPPTVQVAGKYGAVNQSRSEVVLVNAPAGDYVLSVITRNQEDASWAPGNEGWRLIRDVSRAVYRHFNPHDPWLPAADTLRAP